MKKFFLFFLIIFSCNVKKNLDKKINYSCDEICDIIDGKLYDTLPNGNYVVRPFLNEFKVYEIKCENRKFIVTDSLKILIENSIKKNKCDVMIKEIKSGDTIF